MAMDNRIDTVGQGRGNHRRRITDRPLRFAWLLAAALPLSCGDHDSDNPAGTFVAPDGTITTVASDGSATRVAPDGTVTTVGSDGTTQVTDGSGVVTVTTPDGTTAVTTPDGTTTTTTPDGTTTTTQGPPPGTTPGGSGTGSTGSTATGTGGTGSIGSPPAGGEPGVGATGGVPADAQPTPTDSGIEGTFRVDVNTGQVLHEGTPFQVRAGSWFGLEGQDDVARPGAMELYIGSVFWADDSIKRDIQTTMSEVQSAPLGLNTIRLPVAPQCLIPNHPDGLYSRGDVQIRNNDPAFYPYNDCRGALQDFLKQADANGLYVILDIHSCSNHVGWRAGKLDDAPPYVDANRENYKYQKENYYCDRGEDSYGHDRWIEDIHSLARLPIELGVDNVLGIDCFNEPHKYSWAGWADLAAECYQAIAAENDDLIAVVQGVASSFYDESGNQVPQAHGDPTLNPNWGENLYGQQIDPIQVPKDRLCFSPHTYGPSVYVQQHFVDQSNPACVGLEDDAAGKAGCQLVIDRNNPEVVAALRAGWEEHFGYLKDEGYCVMIGEFGGYKAWPQNPVEPQAATIWAHLPSSARYDWEWQNIFVDYLIDEGITDFVYWAINPESGDTGGLYNHAYSLSNTAGWGQWQGFDSEKVDLLGRLR